MLCLCSGSRLFEVSLSRELFNASDSTFARSCISACASSRSFLPLQSALRDPSHSAIEHKFSLNLCQFLRVSSCSATLSRDSFSSLQQMDFIRMATFGICRSAVSRLALSEVFPSHFVTASSSCSNDFPKRVSFQTTELLLKQAITSAAILSLSRLSSQQTGPAQMRHCRWHPAERSQWQRCDAEMLAFYPHALLFESKLLLAS